MKKSILAIAVLALAATNVMAQDEVPVRKYSVATNSFWANWFVQVGANAHMVFSSQEKSTGAGDLGFFKPAERGNIGFTVAVGKWFTPSIGLRTKAHAYRTRRVSSVFAGWGNGAYNYFNIHEDVLFNLSNMFCGYNETRVWNFIPYVGVGFYRNMSNNTNDITYNAGIMNTWRLGKRVNLFIDVYAQAAEGTVDGSVLIPEVNTGKNIDEWARFKKDQMGHWDKQLGVDLGLTFNLGKTGWEKTPDVDALMAMNKEQIDALNASLQEQQNENARLRDMLANQPKPRPNTDGGGETKIITKKELVGATTSVFFNLNSSKIASRKDLVNVKEVAEYAKANNVKVVVTGYADSKTGTTKINQSLSQARANAVAAELVKMGVSRDNIEVVAAGGVNSLTPYPYNRRATVTVK